MVSVIGLLHSIIPYVHKQSGYLVKNPNADLEIKDGESVLQSIRRQPKLLKRLPKSLISKSLGYKEMSRKTLDQLIQHFQTHLPMPVRLKLTMYTVSKNVHCSIPHLMYRQDSDAKSHLKELEGMFGLHKFQDESDE